MLKEKNRKIANQTGFTLIEILIITSLIIILFSVLIVVINPSKKIESAYNAARASDSKTIASAVQQYFIDNESYSGLGITTTPKEICNTGFEEAGSNKINCSGYANLSNLVSKYTVAIPADPTVSADESGSGYVIYLDSTRPVVYSNRHNTNTNVPSFDRNISFAEMDTPLLVLVAIIILAVIISSIYILRSRSNRGY
jgi:type II secretory pathway pseudopilin PulG